jgi:hypothetical protein
MKLTLGPPHQARSHWRTTSCLCLCHFVKAPCDDLVCRAAAAQSKAA